jgi:ankyrin repeat protein
MGGEASIVTALVTAGADIDAKRVNDETPLHGAAFHGHKEASQVRGCRAVTFRHPVLENG